MEVNISTNLAENIITIINDLCKKFGVAIDWTAENILPKIQELIGKFITYRIGLLLSLLGLALFLSILFLILGLIQHHKDTTYSSTLQDFYWISFVICALFLLIMGIICAIHIPRCIAFPELEVYKYLVNSGKWN